MKNRGRFILTAWLLLGLSLAYSQAPLVKQWDARFGGTGDELLQSFQQTPDGGYLLTGYTFSDSGADIHSSSRGGAFDAWIVKTDSLGKIQWERRFGGNDFDQLVDAQPTTDGGYIFGGRCSSGSGGDVSQPGRGFTDCWMVKTDSLGNKQWDKRFGNTRADNLYAIRQTKDGGYILGGATLSDSGADVSQPSRDTGSILGGDAWLVKTDALGNKLWDRRYGGPLLDYIMSIQQTSDGGYIAGGYTKSDSGADISGANRGGSDYWIIKTDANGYKQWDQRYGGTDIEALRTVEQTKDGGYILGGFSYSPISGDKTQDPRGTTPDCDYWIVKTDSLGTKQWDKRFGGTKLEDDFGYVRQTRDGGYLVSGTSYSQAGGDKTEDNLGEEQGWIVKTNSAGVKQWDKTIFTVQHDEVALGIPTADGGYAVASYTLAGTGGYVTQPTRGVTDFWMIKFADTASRCNLAPQTITADRNIFCSGDSVQLCAPAGFVTYAWNEGSAGVCASAKRAGNYYVSLTDANDCTVESNRLAINTYPAPSVSITVQGNVITSNNGVLYQWYLNGDSIPGANDSTYTAQQAGNYTVQITDGNGCSTTSNSVYIGTTGMGETANWQNISMYPNPASGRVFIAVPHTTLPGTVALLNVLGQQVKKQAIPPAGVLALDIPELPAGIYQLLFTYGQQVVARKHLIVQQ